MDADPPDARRHGSQEIIKIEGSYHGHHDSVMVSQWRSLDMLGPADHPHRVAVAGIPQAMADLVHLVPFNDLEALERVLHANQGSIAGMIMEPMMMNAGIIPPDAGYLDGRSPTHPHVRRVADLRRGQDRPQRASRRRDRVVRRHARHRLPGQGTRQAVCRAARSAARTR